jgi:hypothetical protein
LEEMMRALRFWNAAILSTLVAASSALYAQQDEKQQENKPPRHEEPRPEPRQGQEPRPETRPDEMKTPRQDQARQPKQENREQRQDEQRQDERQSREPMKPGRQEGSRQDAHARPAGKGGHIPDDRFRAQFGRSHTFVAQRPVIVEGQPRFQYSGYSFILIDAWPADWAYTDDCYIEYVDGDYFLFDLLHPGERIALIVVM